MQAALDILGLSSTAAGLHTPLVELGLDSMQAVNMRGTIQSALNVSYPLSEVGSSNPPWHTAQQCSGLGWVLGMACCT